MSGHTLTTPRAEEPGRGGGERASVNPKQWTEGVAAPLQPPGPEAFSRNEGSPHLGSDPGSATKQHGVYTGHLTASSGPHFLCQQV